MHDQLLVGALDGVADLAEDLQAGRNREAVRLAIRGEGLTDYILHDDVGQPFLGGPSVVEGGDVGVIEGGQNLALIAKARKDGRVVGLEAEEF